MLAMTAPRMEMALPTDHDSSAQMFEATVRRYSSDLLRYALWLCRNRDLAEEIVQETFLRAWRARDSMRDQAAAKAWLMTILRREHARHYERHRPELSDVETESLQGWDAADKSTEAFVLRRALARLPDHYREPLVLQVLVGHSCEEIGQILGITRSAVMTRVFRAKQKLRATLEQEEPRECAAA